jgi:N-acetylmuramoyl-L-alanine amidase
MANQLRADLFVSIHANAFRSRLLGGVETFFHSIEASGEEAQRVASFENAPEGAAPEPEVDTLSFILEDMQQAEKLRDSSRLAHLVQERLAECAPFENRGVMQADFVVLRGTRMPSILIELGFLTNPQDEKALRDPAVRAKMARAIQKGILEYWKLVRSKTVRMPTEVGSR